MIRLLSSIFSSVLAVPPVPPRGSGSYPPFPLGTLEMSGVKKEKVPVGASAVLLKNASIQIKDEDGEEYEHCWCPECRLKFHMEVAKEARDEIFALERKGSKPKVECMGSAARAKNAQGKSNSIKKKNVKQGKGSVLKKMKPKRKGKGKGNANGSAVKTAFPRGWMPWSVVCETVAEATLFDAEDVKRILENLKQLATKEVMSGHSFNYPGLALFKKESNPRIIATPAEGRAWDCISVYGVRDGSSHDDDVGVDVESGMDEGVENVD